jgi:hypothetical protein
MDVTPFSPQIPPAWLAYKEAEKVAGKIYCTATEKVVTAESDQGVYYNINTYGYREAEYANTYFEYEKVILTFGHSCVFGTTVRNEYSWPRLLERTLPNTRVLNFGIPGASMDTIARMVTCVVPYIKPLCRKLEVVCLWAQKERREIFQENYKTSWSPWKEPPFPEFILSIDKISNNYNYQKNKVMIEAVCAQHDVSLYVVPWEIYERATKDGVDPTPVHHREMLMSVLEQIK